jgi:tRNA dimethylallyltransferase
VSVDARPPGIALLGPTAAGKSAIALELAAELGGEIISVDSAQVYRGLDIGAAKPDAAERAAVPHHLLDLRAPGQPYSVAEFLADADAALAGILARGRVPIFVGGTSLYFQALFDGLAAMPEADPALRAAIADEARQRGWPALHADLAEADPVAAARIGPHDQQRIQRALEVWRLSGVPISAWQERPVSRRLACRLQRWVIAPSTRGVLHQRIVARFDAMLAGGLLDEVRALAALPALAGHPAPLSLPALRAVGYRQAWEFLHGHGDVASLRLRGIAATRQLAKRQLTWLRARPELRWFDPADDRPVLRQVLRSALA